MIETVFGAGMLAHGGPWGGGWEDGWWLARLAVMVVWIVLVVTIVRFVIFGRFRGRGRGPWGPPPVSPLAQARGVLAERFARGEIEAGEYRAKVEELRD